MEFHVKERLLRKLGWFLCLARDAQLNVCSCHPGSSCANLDTHLGWKEGEKKAPLFDSLSTLAVFLARPVSGFQERRKKAPVAPSLTVQRPFSQSTTNRRQHSRPKGQQGCPVSAPLPLTFQTSPWFRAWQVEPRAKEKDGRWQRLDSSHNPQRRFSLLHCSTSSTSLEGNSSAPLPPRTGHRDWPGVSRLTDGVLPIMAPAWVSFWLF